MTAVLTLEARPGTYALVFCSPAEAEVQVGRLGRIRLRPGWYVYVGSALAAKTGVLRRVARHADPTRPKKWNVDHVKPHLRLLEVWFTHDPARRECDWSAAVGSLPGAEVPLRKFGAQVCQEGCPAHFYFFRGRPTLDDFRRVLQRTAAETEVGRLAAATPAELAAQLASLVRTIPPPAARRRAAVPAAVAGPVQRAPDAGDSARHESTPEEIAYLRGRRYLDALLAAGRPVLRQPHRTTLKHAVLLLPFSRSDPGSQVADALAAELGTDRRTVQADARYAAAVDTIALNCGEQARALLLRGGPLLDRRTAEQISRTAPQRQRYEMGLVAEGRRAMRGAAPVFDTVDFGEVVSRLRRASGLVRLGLRVLRAALAVPPPNTTERAEIVHRARVILDDANLLAAGVRSAPEAKSDDAGSQASRSTKPAVRGSSDGVRAPTCRHAAGRLNQAYSFIKKSARDLPTLLREASPTADEKDNVEGLVGRIAEDAGAILGALGDQVGTLSGDVGGTCRSTPNGASSPRVTTATSTRANAGVSPSAPVSPALTAPAAAIE